MAQQFRVGKPTGAVTWQDGTAFNGYLAVQITPMETAGGSSWTAFSIGNRANLQRIPEWVKLSIVEGAYVDDGSGLIYNADITPPGTEYVGYMYDATDKLIAGPTSNFSVTASTFTPPSLTLPNPVQS